MNLQDLFYNWKFVSFGPPSPFYYFPTSVEALICFLSLPLFLFLFIFHMQVESDISILTQVFRHLCI